MSQINDLIDFIDTNMKLITYLQVPVEVDENGDTIERVSWYERVFKDELTDKHFPRVEIAMSGDDNWVYSEQLSLSPLIGFTIYGYVKWNTPTVDSDALTRIKTMSDFYMQAKAVIFKMNKMKITGLAPCTGFLRVHDTMNGDIAHEVIPNMSAFEFKCAIEIDQKWNTI